MMAIKVGKGRSEVTITGPLADGLEREIRSLLGPLADRMDAEASRILNQEIRPNWPVKSGDSLRAWKQTLRVHPGTFVVEAVLHNPLRRTRHIKSKKIGKSGIYAGGRYRSPLQVHAREPVKAARKLLKKELPTLLTKHLQEAVDG